MNNLILKAAEVNPTTIIPNFGAIMKMGKTFMYNEFLKYDDGKLAKFIAEERSIDESLAKTEIQDWVANIQDELNAGKVVVLDGIGELSKVDGKMKFTAKQGTTSASPVETTEKKPEETKESTGPITEVSAPKKETKQSENSSDFKAKEAAEMIEQFNDKSELINFTRGETRKTVIAALNTRLDELNGKKKEVIKKPEPIPTEVQTPKNVINEVVVEPKLEETKPIEPEVVAPIIATAEEVVTPVVTENKVEESIPEEIEPLKNEKPVVEEKSIKEKASEIETPVVSKEEEEAAIAAIVSGVEQTEKQKGKRKKRWILWVGLLLVLLGGGALGYLKKDMIMGWFEKKHEPKDLAESKNETKKVDELVEKENTPIEESHEDVADTNNEMPVNEEPQEVVEDPIINEVVEVEKPVEEPKVKEKPVINSSSEGSWHIIAGSYSSEDNANNKVATLKDAGYASAKVLGKYNGLYTVRVASYSTKEEAKSALATFSNSGNSGIIKKL